TYDSVGDVLTSTDRLGNVESFQYEPVFNNVTQYTDKLGQITTFGYDPKGNLTSVTQASGSLNLTTGIGYDPFGEPTGVTDPLTDSNAFGYDSSGNLTSITDALTNKTIYEHDGLGRLTKATDPLGRSVSLAYNALYLTSVTDSASATTQFVYDQNGNITSVTDALQDKTTAIYDPKNRLTSATDPIGRTFAATYDLDDELTSTTSPSGRTTHLTYENRGLLASAVDAIGGVANFNYDNHKDLTSITDQRGFSTSYSYDGLFRVVGAIDPAGASSSVGYDAESNLVSATDRIGRSTTLSYDQIHRLVQATYADATVNYTYDAASRLTQVSDTQSGTINWVYDDANRLTSETTTVGVVSYGYNTAGQKASMTAANLPAVSYAYDTAGRLETISQGADTFTITYDTLSRRIGLQRPNGINTTYAYDSVSRLVSLTDAGAQSNVNSLAYSYDLDGEVASVASLQSTLPTPTNFGQADPANRIRSVGTATVQFDAEGQVASKTDGSGARAYQWDARGRLTQVTLPSNEAVTYQYDPFGRRISTTSGGVSTNFLYDGQDVVLDKGSDGNSTNYVNGATVDEKLEQTGTTGPLYFTQDRLGSTTTLTDAMGNVAESEAYDAFGASAGSALTRYGFTGRELDSSTGLMFYRARWYDPAQGRFLTEDPLGYGSGLNLYRYVGDDPVGFTDPMGLQTAYQQLAQRFTPPWPQPEVSTQDQSQPVYAGITNSRYPWGGGNPLNGPNWGNGRGPSCGEKGLPKYQPPEDLLERGWRITGPPGLEEPQGPVGNTNREIGDNNIVDEFRMVKPPNITTPPEGAPWWHWAAYVYQRAAKACSAALDSVGDNLGKFGGDVVVFVGPFKELWRIAHQNGQLPPPEALGPNHPEDPLGRRRSGGEVGFD
ncbi:MAG: RHS repeat-associated core domain-containing protein, partial [Blastocatellia bacterium]